MKKVYILFLMILLLLSGCGSNEQNTFYQDMCLGENEIFLYNVSDEKLGVYNIKDCTWYALYEEDNTFQYVFDNDSEYVVSGNSIDNGLVLLKVSEDKKKIEKVFDLNNNKNCFFPLAKSEDDYYYVMYIEEDQKKVKRMIFSFSKDYRINNLLETDKKITSGLVIDDRLYCTVYNESAQNYGLFYLNILAKEKQFFDMNKAAETRDLFRYENDICVSDHNYIFCKAEKIKKQFINYIEEDTYIIQFYANDENNMVCTVKNIKTGDDLGTFFDPVNYEVRNNKIKIYCKTGIYDIDI